MMKSFTTDMYGYVFSDTGIRVASIESKRIILQINETEFPVELEEL